MTPTTIRIEDSTKEQAKKVAEELGLSFNSLVNSLLKKAIREGGVDLRTENGFSTEFEESILRTEAKKVAKK